MKKYTTPEIELQKIALSGNVCDESTVVDNEDGTDFGA